MAKQEIRIHYSGLILFSVKLLTVATGIVFVLMVSNSLSQPEYGVYGIFSNTIIPYFTLLSGVISFWAMRFVARGKEGAIKTGVVANMTMATIATLVYLAALPLVTNVFRVESYAMVYLVAATQIIETYLITILEVCLQATRPHFVGYGLLIGEVLKVAFAYTLLLRFQLGLVGAILSVVAAFGIKVAFYFKTVLRELRQKIVFSYIREWVKGSTFNIYSVIGDRIAAIIFVMLVVFGREIAASYFTATVQITNVIAYSSFLAFALYPKLLAERKMDEATATLKLVLMFVIPMTAGVLAIPTSYLMFLKEDGVYAVATPVLIILAVDALTLTISGVFSSILFGIERVDEKAEIPFRQVRKSRLFTAFSLPFVHSAITLPVAYYAMTHFTNGDPLLVTIYVTGINTIGHVITFIILYSVLRKAVKVKIPWKSIGKYVAASAIMALVLFAGHPIRRSSTLIFTAVGSAVYLGLILAFDGETRTLARDILHTAIRKINKRT